MDQTTSSFIIAVSGSLLVFVITGLCIILWNMLKKMDSKIENHVETLGTHHTTLELHEQTLDLHEKRLDSHSKQITSGTSDLADDIVNKIKLHLKTNGS